MAKKVEKEDVRFVDYTKDLTGAILQVRKDGQKLKHKIHNVALSIIRAWGTGQIKDQSPADYFNALSDAAGYHGKPLANWIALKLKGKLSFSEENEKWYVEKDAKVNGDDFKSCRDEPFWEVSPPPKASPVDYAGLLYGILAKNAKASAPDVHAKREEKGLTDRLIPTDVARRIREILAEAGVTEEQN